MKPFAKYGVAILAALALTACDDDDDDIVVTPPPPTAPIESGYVRVLHASPDAPLVNVLVNDAVALESVDYAAGSGFVELEPAAYTFAVDALLPGDMTARVIEVPDVLIESEMEYSVIAVGKVADETLQPLLLSRPRAEFGEGNIRLQILHASPDAPAVDIYLTEPMADIAMMDPALAAVEFTQNSDLIEVAAGDYQARVTVAGTKDVVYDTGTLSLAAGTDLLLAAVTNTVTGEAPIALVAWSAEGTMSIPDMNAGAELRVVHASPDAPNVNVLANGMTALTDVPYTGFSDYLNVPAGDYQIQVEPTEAPGTFVIDAMITAEQDMAYTVLAINNVAEIAPWVVVDENRRRIATEAGLRLFHASPTAGPVDIYLGTDMDISDEEPAFTGVPIGMETGRLSLAAGDYVVTVTPTGTKDAAIGPLMVTLEANMLYTAIARDEVGGGLPLGLILMDDFVPEPAPAE
ncbi:DUF4397 domain-containing protein [Ferrimonas marina]|uniref:DUF4397 domain-containing protein n=1 Tax=Ferrimonas marina TaxID=299255 RepID=A0A1M5Z3C9_9GAMM|nr:DUF4397 domain-containing protein [Ferrimonas marina]SHI18730.1 protein of unknown function [Ferrimonas marina]